MKKTILILALTLVLFMSGCGTQNGMTKSDCETNGGKWIAYMPNVGCVYETYYTQEEVDTLLTEQYIEIVKLVMENYIQSYDGKLYNNCRIENSIKVCDEIIIGVK